MFDVPFRAVRLRDFIKARYTWPFTISRRRLTFQHDNRLDTFGNLLYALVLTLLLLAMVAVRCVAAAKEALNRVGHTHSLKFNHCITEERINIFLEAKARYGIRRTRFLHVLLG